MHCSFHYFGAHGLPLITNSKERRGKLEKAEVPFMSETVVHFGRIGNIFGAPFLTFSSTTEKLIKVFGKEKAQVIKRKHGLKSFPKSFHLLADSFMQGPIDQQIQILFQVVDSNYCVFSALLHLDVVARKFKSQIKTFHSRVVQS